MHPFSLQVLLLLVSAFAVMSAAVPTVQVTSHTCVPISGGLTYLFGTGFPSSLNFSVSVGGAICREAAVISSTMAMCYVSAVTDPSPAQLVVNNVVQALSFRFCAAVINDISASPNPPNTNWTISTVVLTISGQNFGLNAAAISIYFQRHSDTVGLPCTNVTTIDISTFNCTLSATDHGQYFAYLTVAGLNSPSNGLSSINLGICYYHYNINPTTVDLVLTQVSLERNLNKLLNLIDTLRQVKAALPPMDSNDCGADSAYSYPVPSFELQFLSSDSFEFKDCMDSFCSQREQFLSTLPTGY